MKNRLLAASLACLTLVSLTGCKGTVDGRETVELAAGYYNNGSYAAPFPSMNSVTQLHQVCDEYLKFIAAGDYNSAINMMTLTDLTFVDIEKLSDYVASSGLDLTQDIVYTEQSIDGMNYVMCSNAGSNTGLLLQVITEVDAESGAETLKLNVQDFVLKDYTLKVPAGIKLTLDGIDISSYVQEDGSYKVPYISAGAHKTTIHTIFSDIEVPEAAPIEVELDVRGSFVDLSPYLGVTGALKGKLEEMVVATLIPLNGVIMKNDWDNFTYYFPPGKNLTDFTIPFHSGYTAKEKIYDLQLTYWRALNESPLDVRFTGYNTVEVSVCTRWKWVAPRDYTYVEATGEYIVSQYSEMQPINTLELYFDGSTYYLNDIDDASITRMTNGLYDWR